MTTLLIRGGNVYTPFEVIANGAVFARDGVIERVGATSDVESDADVVVNATGRVVCPGFVDLQVNGGGSALLTEEPTRESLERMATAHVRFGTTSMLATVVTSPEQTLTNALAAVANAVQRPPAGTRIIGAHAEGPFINPVRKGAHNERNIVPPDVGLFERLAEAADGALRVVTLAPELPGALDLIAAARKANVVVSIGHSDATYEEAMAGIEAGATMSTHLFNAMRPLKQRDPGISAAVLRDGRVVAGMIADGVHVDPALLDVAYRAKGADGIALVTDAMSPVGSDETSFQIYGGEVAVRDGACYTQDGVLAGSALTMNRAIRLMRDEASVPLLDAVQMATATPALVLGREDIGVLKAGACADVVICDDDLNVERVFVGGVEAT